MLSKGQNSISECLSKQLKVHIKKAGLTCAVIEGIPLPSLVWCTGYISGLSFRELVKPVAINTFIVDYSTKFNSKICTIRQNLITKSGWW